MVVDNNNLQPLVSFGTLMALWLVCNAMLYRRYVPDVQVRATRWVEASVALFGLVACWGGWRSRPQRPEALATQQVAAAGLR